MPTRAESVIATRPWRVAHVLSETADVSSYYLEPADAGPLPPYAPGQHVVVHLTADETGDRACAYSLSTAPGRSYYRITVQHCRSAADGGGGCRRCVQSLVIGSVVQLTNPQGMFLLPSSTRPLVLISGGIGITPLYAMLEWLVKTGDPRPVTFIHTTANSGTHLFAEAVHRVTATALVRLHVAYTQPTPADLERGGFDSVGRLSAAAIRTIVTDSDAEFLLCGPTSFLRDLTAGLRATGIPESHLHVEQFMTAPALPADAPDVVVPVRFRRSGVSVPWNPAFSSLLDFAEAQGLAPDYFCRAGMCGTCEYPGSGQVAYTVDLAVPPASGRIRLCCARPLGPVELDL